MLVETYLGGDEVFGQQAVFSGHGGYHSDTFKSWLVDGAEFKGFYEIPQLLSCSELPREAIPFPEA